MSERFLKTLIYSVFVLLMLELFYTQVVRFGHYSRLSKNNSIRIIPIDGPRGNIIDRNGIKMVSNKLCFDVAVVYQELSDMDKLIDILISTLGVSREKIEKGLDKASHKPFAPVTIIEDVDKDKAIALEEESVDVRGLIIETRSRRDYIYGDTGAHVFGYLSEITEEELGEYGYQVRDLVGRSGLEKYYDRYLAGSDGGTQVQVDSRGHPVKVLGMKEPSSGKDLYLTIDANIQETCDKLLAGKTGAIVVMNPNTGEVLALSSRPAFDPNVFVRSNTSAERVGFIKDRSGRPLSNRAISGQYALGSIFKIVTASAGLETGKINAGTHFLCTGSFKFGNRQFGCWKKEGHGSQDVTDALMNSCNVFFYNTGKLAGVDALEYYSKIFGLGKPTGIDLPDEVNGLVPGKLWKRFSRGADWYEGETINFAIGQGYLLVTPIQIVCLAAVEANGGNLVKPYIVRKIDKAELSVTKPKKLPLKESTIEKVREGILKVVSSEGGTGKRAKIEGVLVAGKTSTAQNPQGRTHAWFAGFAPFKHPKVCVVVFIEHGGHGGLEPAEIAHGIFQEAKNRGYF